MKNKIITLLAIVMLGLSSFAVAASPDWQITSIMAESLKDAFYPVSPVAATSYCYLAPGTGLGTSNGISQTVFVVPGITAGTSTAFGVNFKIPDDYDTKSSYGRFYLIGKPTDTDTTTQFRLDIQKQSSSQSLTSTSLTTGIASVAPSSYVKFAAYRLSNTATASLRAQDYCYLSVSRSSGTVSWNVLALEFWYKPILTLPTKR